MARIQRSLFGEILDWMLAPLLVLWPMTWLVAQGIANQPYDRALGEMTRTLSKHVVFQPPASGKGQAVFTLPAQASEILRADETDDIHYQVLGLRGEWLSGDKALPVPASDEKTVHGELRFRDDEVRGDVVRVAYIWVDLAGREGQTGPLVQVAETRGKRSQLATEIIKGVMLPQFVILPLAVLLVWLALARGFAPLNELQQRIRRRDSSDLSPIDEGEAPEEVAPLVGAINDLLERLDQSMRAQKHFLADAAHQLKTPLAGLRTQAELAQRETEQGRGDAEGIAAISRCLQHIARSSQNAAHMVNQLLAMAHAEDQGQARRSEWVSLADLAVEVVRDMVPKAMESRIDLGYEGERPGDAAADPPAPQALRVRGNPVLLRELLRNLVDNALKYTPPGGSVTVRVLNDPFGQVVALQVEDTGPGIAPAEREQVFKPFYRALGTNVDGSGLGLAIVQEIALQHGAEISLGDAHPQLRAGTGEEGEAEPARATGPGALFTLRFQARLATEVSGAGVNPGPAL
jgi:two-component system sensor histidine kinase TctE